jgi:hypothetical protein
MWKFRGLTVAAQESAGTHGSARGLVRRLCTQHATYDRRRPAAFVCRWAGGQIERSTRLGGLLSDYRQMPVAA